MDRVRGYLGNAQGDRMKVSSRFCSYCRRFVFARSFLRAASANVSGNLVYSRTDRRANLPLH